MIKKNNTRQLIEFVLKHWIISLFSSLFLLMLLSWLIVFCSFTPIGVIYKENQGDWLQWFASILSGFIGGLFTYLGVKISIDRDKERRDYENKRLVLPLVKLGVGTYDYRNSYFQFDFLFTEESKSRERKNIVDTARVTFEIKNVGQREMFDVHIGCFDSTFFKANIEYYIVSPIIYKDDSTSVSFLLYEKGIYDNDKKDGLFHLLISAINFTCFYKDCFNNWYSQNLGVSLFHQIIPGTSINSRAINVSISRTSVNNAPEEILEKDLPWNKSTVKI